MLICIWRRPFESLISIFMKILFENAGYSISGILYESSGSPLGETSFAVVDLDLAYSIGMSGLIKGFPYMNSAAHFDRLSWPVMPLWLQP